MIHANSFARTNGEVPPSFSRGNYREAVLFFPENGAAAMYHTRETRTGVVYVDDKFPNKECTSPNLRALKRNINYIYTH